MKKYLIVKNETLTALLDCFSSQEEFYDFGYDLSLLIEEIIFTGAVARREQENTEQVKLLAVKQFFLLAMFCRENMDLIKDLVNVVEYTEISEEEKQKLDDEYIDDGCDDIEG